MKIYMQLLEDINSPLTGACLYGAGIVLSPDQYIGLVRDYGMDNLKAHVVFADSQGEAKRILAVYE